MSFHRESREELVAPIESNEGLLCVNEFSCHHDWSWPGPSNSACPLFILSLAAMRRIPDFRQAMRLSMTPSGSTADETPRRRYRPHIRGRDHPKRTTPLSQERTLHGSDRKGPGRRLTLVR